MTDTTDGPKANPSPHSNGMRFTTLGKLGPRMPIGIEVNGEYHKDFEWRPWRMKEERQLAEYRENNPGQTIGAMLAHMIGVMAVKLGPHRWGESITEAEKQLTITQMYLADVLYLYVYLRKAAMGSAVPAMLQCPNCQLKNKRDLDLDGLDVRVLDDPDSLVQAVELSEGIKIFGELRKRVQIRPPRWQIMMNPELMRKNNDALRTIELFKECVCGAEGIAPNQPIVLDENDIDELTKLDISKLENAIENVPGPQMIVQFDCSRCQMEVTQMVDYRYESFFTTSLPQLPGGS